MKIGFCMLLWTTHVSEAHRAVIEDLKQHARRKLELVLKYAQTHRCRRQMILDYFGDASSEVRDCQCDVCSRGKDVSTASAGAGAATAPSAMAVTQHGCERCVASPTA